MNSSGSGRQPDTQRPARSERRSFRGAAAVLAVLALVSLGVAVSLGPSFSVSGREILPGVEVGDVPVGGKTPDQAERAVRERVAQLEEVRLSGGGQEVTLRTEEVGLDPDVRTSVESAYKVGREGNLFERLGDRIGSSFGTVEVPLRLEYDSAAMDRWIEDLERELGEKVRPADVVTDGGEAEVVPAREGYRLDTAETSRNVREAVESLEGEAELAGEVIEPEIQTEQAQRAAESARRALEEPATFTADDKEWRVSPTALSAALDFEREDGRLRLAVALEAVSQSLADAYSELTAEPREADFLFSGGEVEVVPSETGQRVERRKLVAALEDRLPKGEHDFEISVVKERPELTTERAERLKPTQRIGRYRTTFENTGDDDPARIENLEKASRALSGQTIAPGEVFSTVDVLEPLSYNKTKVFIDGKVEEAEGGGLCQVSSTLYMAVNYAGLKSVERYPHFAMLNYIRPGLDATVWFGRDGGQQLDMKFKNTSDGYVMLREYVADDGYVYAEVWARPTGRDVTMRSVENGTTEESSTWTTYKRVEENGEVLFSGEFHKDTYEAVETDDGVVSPDELTPAPVNP